MLNFYLDLYHRMAVKMFILFKPSNRLFYVIMSADGRYAKSEEVVQASEILKGHEGKVNLYAYGTEETTQGIMTMKGKKYRFTFKLSLKSSF
jgi:hypothetical protein